MKTPTILCLFCLHFIYFAAAAQTVVLDTFIRKDGIHSLTQFTLQGKKTLFPASKNNRSKAAEPISTECTQRVKAYASISKKEIGLRSNFSVVRYLETKDSTGYFNFIEDMPVPYQFFFKALYLVEENEYKHALPIFDSLLSNSFADSIILKETVFWKNITQQLFNDQSEYNTICDLYARLEKPKKEHHAYIMNAINSIYSPAYLFHKYLLQYNYYYRTKNYTAAKEVYDSVLKYTTHTKMKASLTQNKTAVLEMLDAKDTYRNISQNQLYYYQLADLYEHLTSWGKDTVTKKQMAEDAGFKLQTKFSKNEDSVFTRWLRDTANDESKSKFEALSFTRTPWDREGRKLVMVKLSFSNEDTYNYYLPQLAKFKNKAMYGSLFFANRGRLDGNEYLLTKYFVAALYQQEDPITKYVLCLYCVEDKEGKLYAVDTLF